MTFDDELKHAFEALTARLQTELERQIDAAKAVLAAAAPPPPLPPAPKEEEPAPSARGAEADERLVEGIRSIDNARSLSEILDALASAAARDASRVAVLLTSGGEWRAWRTSGFDQEPDVATLAAVAADASHDSRGRVRLPLAITPRYNPGFAADPASPMAARLAHAASSVLGVNATPERVTSPRRRVIQSR